MRKTKAKVLGGFGQHALTVDDDRRHLAERGAEYECRSVQHRRPVHHPREHAGKRAVGDRRRRGGVEGAGRPFVLRTSHDTSAVQSSA